MTKPLSKYLEDFYWYSEKASEVTRTAAYAGIALVWVFRVENHPSVTLPRELLLPAACFAFAVAFDVLQYVAGARIWDAFHREHELGADEGADPELDHPRDLTQPIRFFYWGKVVAVGLGYLAVFAYLCGAWLTA